MNINIFKKRCIVIFMVSILISTVFPVAALAKAAPNYDNIKLLFTGPFADYGPFGESEPVIINDVPSVTLLND